MLLYQFVVFASMSPCALKVSRSLVDSRSAFRMQLVGIAVCDSSTMAMWGLDAVEFLDSSQDGPEIPDRPLLNGSAIFRFVAIRFECISGTFLQFHITMVRNTIKCATMLRAPRNSISTRCLQRGHHRRLRYRKHLLQPTLDKA